MLSGLVRIGGYAFLFAAVSTVGQAIGFGGGSPESSRVAAGRVTTVLDHVPGTAAISAGGFGLPGAETRTFGTAGHALGD